MQDKFRIRIFVDDTATQYARFLPTRRRCEPLADLVFFYIGDELDWDVELAIAGRRRSSRSARRVGRSSAGPAGWRRTGREPDETIATDARFHPAERRGEAARALQMRREDTMADISLEAVTGKLNRIGYEAFIQALRQAKSAGNRNVELAHWLPASCCRRTQPTSR